MHSRRLGAMGIAALMLGLVVGCSDDDDNGTSPPVSVDQFEVVQQAFDTYLSSGAAPTINSSDVYDQITDTNPANRPYVLSVRGADHYAIGHVPTATNIPWRGIGELANLSTLPTDETIVVYCYTGHTGQLATACLNAMGYSAVNMKHGIMAWSKDENVRAQPPFSDPLQDYPLETTANPLTETFETPDLDVTSSDDPDVIVRSAVAAYASTAAPVITAADLWANINDGNAANDYFIVSVRGADHYALGHVRGAHNIPWREIAKPENLAKLPTDQPIVVYCYTGHTGQVAAAVLGTLGYDVVNLKFGICAWTSDPAIRVAAPFREDDFQDYPVDTGAGL